ncbi:MAG: hypothetical protein D6719_00340 [Candidatus Dadabacteria bacterium]|nr:MAG: hypothetical protein D6719_00340 [Candidatus Dadabacteria bacterium]
MIGNLTSEERILLKAFNKHGVRYIIVGLSSAVLQGAHVITQDIDLWVEHLGSEQFLNAVKEAGAFYVPPGVAGVNPPMLGPGAFRIFDLVTHMHGLDEFSVEYDKAEIMNLSGIEVRILPLERIIVSKAAADREKDRAVLPALKAALAVKSNLK